MKRLLIIGVLLLSSLSYSANNYSVKLDRVAGKEQDSIYKARKTWIEDKKYELLALCDKLINANDFPKTNIEKERDKLKLKLRMYVKEIQSVDFTDDKKFEGIQKKLVSMEYYFRGYPMKLRERENLKR